MLRTGHSLGRLWVGLSRRLRPSDAPTGGRLFGRDVAVDDGTIVIGPDQDADARGAAYVFRRSGGTWQETQKLTASDPAPGEFFDLAQHVMQLLGDPHWF